MKYGFIGLGNLGRHLAASLIREGFEVTVHDLNREAAADLLAAGATWADSPRAAAQATDSLITCLPSPKASTAVMTGENGALEGIPAGGAWIEMSTNDAHEIERIAALGAARGVVTLEAPVTGGVHRAAAGEITVLIGGDEAAYRAHLPAFRAMGGEVLHMGPLGKASVIKVITNMLAFIHLVAAGEALMLAKRGGLDLKKSFEAIRASSGNSFVHETESQVILNGSYNIGFTMDLACKDAGFATQMGREFGVPLALAGMTEQIFIQAREQFGGDAWSSMVVKILEDAVGEQLRAPGFPAELTAEDA
ncbi:MAG: NAD(P)-dependent oxidoreductase [Alphaproteobacteria bacterium]|nr:NAD(P)-dependent oxidoreductase [Alphaproteobacteria bacterium]